MSTVNFSAFAGNLAAYMQARSIGATGGFANADSLTPPALLVDFSIPKPLPSPALTGNRNVYIFSETAPIQSALTAGGIAAGTVLAYEHRSSDLVRGMMRHPHGCNQMEALLSAAMSYRHDWGKYAGEYERYHAILGALGVAAKQSSPIAAAALKELAFARGTDKEKGDLSGEIATLWLSAVEYLEKYLEEDDYNKEVRAAQVICAERGLWFAFRKPSADNAKVIARLYEAHATAEAGLVVNDGSEEDDALKLHSRQNAFRAARAMAAWKAANDGMLTNDERSIFSEIRFAVPGDDHIGAEILMILRTIDEIPMTEPDVSISPDAKGIGCYVALPDGDSDPHIPEDEKSE